MALKGDQEIQGRGPRRGLGRGLNALIPETRVEAGARIMECPIASLAPNPYQPRREFPPEKLAELETSIREHGILQPLVVRPSGGAYQIVAGERRFRAAKMAGLESVPAVVRELDDRRMLEIALIENLQRQELNPLEEAQAYQLLLQEFGLTQEQVANRIGVSRSQVTNFLRLLNLEETIKEKMTIGSLTVGHAKVLLGIESGPQRLRLAERVGAEGLSVKEAEALASGLRKKSKGKPPAAASPEAAALEERLRLKLGSPVRVILTGKGKGRIEIAFFDWGELERIAEAVGSAGH